MKRNSGIVGPRQLVDNANQPAGVFDTFDAYNMGTLWPDVPQSVRIDLNATSFNEGSTVTATIYITGVNAGQSLNWNIKYISGNSLSTTDFSALNGSFSVPASYVYTLNITISNDSLTEGTESFQIEVKNGSTLLGTSSTFTVADTSTGTPEPTDLYAFTTFTFTNAGISGRLGPTRTDCLNSYDTSTYSWLNNTDYFNVVTQGYQLWTVPKTGNFVFTVIGAAGGTGYFGSFGTPGYGARMVSTLSLTKSQKLIIIVGQRGANSSGSTCGQDGAGGGGTFVFTEGGTCLIAAGGGGGGSYNGSNRDPTRRDAPDSTSGNAGSGTTGGAGGTGGNGGSVQSGSCVSGGGAGAGILTDGATNGQSQAAKTYSSGFTGGEGWNVGGFGGGGGAGTSYAAGGGGGYSGGGGGGLQTCSCTDMGNGGGGGCYSSTAYTYTAQIGTDHGSVTVESL